MHPIERLRYVARAGMAPDRVLVAEAVPAFGAFAGNPGALLVALRQLISRQPESPGLTVLGAVMLNSLDPITSAWQLVEAFENDQTSDFADELAIDEVGGIELIESLASGPGQFLGPPGTNAWIESARRRGRSVAVITPLGSRLPRLLWAGFCDRYRAATVGPPPEVVPMDSVDELVGPDGVQPVATWSPDCSDVAELASF